MNKMCLQETHHLTGVLASNTDWGKIERSALTKIEEDPVEAGKLFTEFLKSFETKEVKESNVIQINRSIPFDPAAIFGRGWEVEEQDQMSLSLTEIDLSEVVLLNGLKEGELTIKGEQKIGRLRKAKNILLDFGIFYTLWNDKDLIPEEWKEKTNNETTFICFDGTILRSPSGMRSVLYMYFRDEWFWRQQSLSEHNLFDAATPSAVLPQKV